MQAIAREVDETPELVKLRRTRRAFRGSMKCRRKEADSAVETDGVDAERITCNS